MKTRNLTKFMFTSCFMLSSFNMMSQENPVALLDLSDDASWRYETNANETNSIVVVDAAEAPAGLDIQTEKILKFDTFDVSWDQWWWCGAVAINDPVEITEDNHVLKFKMYTSATKFSIYLKSDPNTQIQVFENAPIEPDQWNILELNLSDYIGTYIERVEFIPQVPNQTFYIYPYFQNAEPKKTVTGTVSELEIMDDANFTYGTNMDGSVTTSVTDITGFTPAIPVATDKAFKITSSQIDWQFWYTAVISLNDSKQIKENKILVGQVYSPEDRINILLKSDDLSLLNTTYNYGERRIIPNAWNEIVLDFKTFQYDNWLQFIEICPTQPGIDVYAYFYWVDTTGSNIDNEYTDPLKVTIQNGKIHAGEAKSVKLYNLQGQQIAEGESGEIDAVRGVNIIVVDGNSYKLFNTSK